MTIILNKRWRVAAIAGSAATAGVLLSGCTAPAPQAAPAPTARPITTTTPAATAGFPLTVENCGTELVFDEAPSRAVTLEQTLTELSLSLGVEAQMVGTSYRTDPILPNLADAYAAVPVLADLYPSQEIVLETAPDFIYAYGPTSVSAENAGTPESYAELGIPVYISPVSCPDDSLSAPGITFSGFFDEVRTLAAIYGVPDAGEALIAEQQARIDAALDGFHVDGDPSFIWWYAGTDTPYFGTGTSDAENYADLLGVDNAFSDGGPGRWASTSWEVIADRDPDVIVLADLTRGNVGDSAQSKIDFLKSNPATAELTAVRNDAFIIVPGSARGYSVRTVESLELIAAGLRDLHGH